MSKCFSEACIDQDFPLNFSFYILYLLQYIYLLPLKKVQGI